MTVISTTVGKKWSGPHSQQKSLKYSSWVQSQKQNDLSLFPRQTIQYALTSNAEEAEVE